MCAFIISFSHNTEKVIYFLLLERKRRRPALEDDDEVRPRNDVVETVDPPKKRLDTCRINGQNCLNFGQISEGSPLTPRRQAFKLVYFVGNIAPHKCNVLQRYDGPHDECYIFSFSFSCACLFFAK